MPTRSPTARTGDLVWIKSHPADIIDRPGIIIEVITLPHPSWDNRSERMYSALVDGSLWTLTSRKQFEVVR